MNGSEHHADVAIVGYGPVGALLGCLLGKRGLSVAIIERELEILQSPRAVHFDGEVMRIFQAAGVADAMTGIARASTQGMHFVNAAGKTLMIRRGMEGIGPHGWHHDYYFHQPDLERVLRQGAERFPTLRVFTGSEVTAISEHGDLSLVRFEGPPGVGTRHIPARYVIGCDGARSLVRRLIGSSCEDLGLHQPWLVVDLIMRRDLSLPNYTVQHCNPERPMTQGYVTGRRRRWEIMLMPGDDPSAMVEPEVVWPLLRKWVSPDDAEIERSALYTFHSVIANGWRKGRMTIAGDAAHQTPPFLGQGMCAGMRDAANLAWKVDLVVHGWASDALLDSYESERKPHVRDFIALAVRVGAVIQATDPRAAEERDRRIGQDSPEFFEVPQPQLGMGVRVEGPPPCGVVFPQPRLADGALLDEAVGGRFAVLGRRDVLAAVPEDIRGQWNIMDIATIADGGDAVDGWLNLHGAGAVIVRPDRYVFGTAHDAEQLCVLTSEVSRRCLQSKTIAIRHD